MEIFIDKNDDLKSAKGGVYALGNFDGVHLGHKEIISNVIKKSKLQMHFFKKLDQNF